MTIRWSAIHEQLGETPRDLDYDLIEAAVKQQVAETDNLDWKRELPPKDEPKLEEFAKDIAAMANTRGGLIIYGVGEDGGGRASSIVGVDATENSRRRLRALAANRVHPMVDGLDVLPLTSSDGSTSVLVLSIPRSPDAPHLIGQKQHLGVPFRSGPETQWMRERELERAYAERFNRRSDEGVRLVDAVHDASEQLDLGRRGAWIVAVARPRTTLPGVIAPPTRDRVRPVLEAAHGQGLDVLRSESHNRWSVLREFASESLNPRVGLRRWVVPTLDYNDPDKGSSGFYVELHHDGSVALAVGLGGWYGSPPVDHHEVFAPMVENFAADFVALAETYLRQLGGEGTMAYRVDLRRSDDRPMFAVTNERGSFGGIGQELNRIPGSRAVRRFTPLVGEVPVGVEIDQLRPVAVELASDVLHQFGVGRLSLFS